MELHPLLRQSGAGNVLARDKEFDRLALALFALQLESVPIYREFCQRRQAALESVSLWSQIPALPVSAFKEFDVSSIPAGERKQVFHSSGTTGHVPSQHFHHARSIVMYEASLLSWFKFCFLGGPSEPMKLVFLTPEHAPHSSLVHMFQTVRRHLGAADSVFVGRLETDGSWSLDFERAFAVLRAAVEAQQAIGVLGTAFSFVHLLEALQADGKRFLLPAGSRVMETGGYKGRSREMPKAQLREMISSFLGVAESRIIAEYGMSELGSQAYDRAGAEHSGLFVFPPWVRAQVISAETGGPAEEGKTGLLRVFDLANIWSVMAVQTEDLVVGHRGGFNVLGRASTSAPRGCSLMAVSENA
ncbi:MAG: long-chain fatty acid--CoA ligase [Limisphaerales bacterium]